MIFLNPSLNVFFYSPTLSQKRPDWRGKLNVQVSTLTGETNQYVTKTDLNVMGLLGGIQGKTTFSD
jgi:hypothetical protein